MSQAAARQRFEGETADLSLASYRGERAETLR